MKQSGICMAALGRYEIVEKLGTGSMGTVYRAKDTILDRQVALKTIRTGIQVESELRERFYREARACARLQHPSIVVVYDLGEVDQIAYIAMELLTGSDFRTLIAQRTPTPLLVKIEVMAQACDALAYAHRHGIIHRDVKPSNLFLTDQNRAKVLDFGIARMPSSKLTVAGRILGTPNYMAPEQILGKPSDTRADLFSAAVVFFEFLVGTHPFRSDVIPRRVVESEPDSLFDYDSTLPIILDKVFTRALAKDPEQRYRTGDEFAADLRAVLDALTRNASPTFSSLQLPSLREIPAAPLPLERANLSLLTPPPPGEDPGEWRLSEVMRLIPLFETATENHQATLAGEILSQLEAIQAVDPRFTDAIQLCRSRFAEADSSRKVTAQAAAAASVSPVLEASRTPAPTAPPPLDLGATLLINPKKGETWPPATAPEVPPAAPTPPISSAAAKPQSPAPAATPGKPPTSVRPPASPAKARVIPLSQKQLVWVGASALIGIMVIVLLWTALSSVPLEHAVATARVATGQAPIFKNASAKSAGGTASRADLVNILKLPRSRSQEWVAVQVLHRNRALRPGYMRTRDLTTWDSPSPDTKLELLRMFQVGGPGSEPDFQTELAVLQNFAAEHKGTRAAHQASLDMAELSLASLRRMKADGTVVANAQLEPVRTYLSDAGQESSLAGRVSDAQNQLDELTREIVPPPTSHTVLPVQPPPPLPKKVDPEQLVRADLDRADQLWKEQKFDEAEAWVTRASKVNKNHEEVLKWQKRIQDRKDLLNR